ncbi:MAG TPA: hypothetical protein VMY37_18205 [Thermoguttaceae bacterium]|nr:hypothetical protein [Thermoguttaceae bacterium]
MTARQVPLDAPVRFATRRGGPKAERGWVCGHIIEPDGSLTYDLMWARGGHRFVRREDMRVIRRKRR